MRDLKDVLLEDFKKDVNLVENWNNYENIIKYSLSTLIRCEDYEVFVPLRDNVFDDIRILFKYCPKFFNALMYEEYILDKDSDDNNSISMYKANANLFCYMILLYKHRYQNSVLPMRLDIANYGFVDLLYNLKALLNSPYKTKIAEVIENTVSNINQYAKLIDNSQFDKYIVEKEQMREMVEEGRYNLLFLNLKAEIRKNVMNDFIKAFPKDKYVDYMEFLIPLSAAVAEVIAVNIIHISYPSSREMCLSSFYFIDITDECIKVVLD